jgi:hypothetical protein
MRAFPTLVLLAAAGVFAADLKVTTINPPNRGGAKDTRCPPNFNRDTGAKSPLDPAKGDKDAAGDKRYYMGEEKLVLTADDGSTTNVIVRDWCIARAPHQRDDGSWYAGDFFSTEILTSKNGTETQRVAPTDPC